MPSEPLRKRTCAFIDGQNLYFAAKDAFGYKRANDRFPDLARAVCERKGWQLDQTRFYTGMPSQAHDPGLYTFWSAKLRAMSQRGVEVRTRPRRYRRQPVTTPDGHVVDVLSRDEKGIDVRIAVDVIRLALQRQYDVALIFSQDQDLSELCTDIREIAREQERWIKIASAFPFSDAVPRARFFVQERLDQGGIDRKAGLLSDVQGQ